MQQKIGQDMFGNKILLGQCLATNGNLRVLNKTEWVISSLYFSANKESLEKREQEFLKKA